MKECKYNQVRFISRFCQVPIQVLISSHTAGLGGSELRLRQRNDMLSKCIARERARSFAKLTHQISVVYDEQSINGAKISSAGLHERIFACAAVF